MEAREPEIWKPIPGYEGLYEISSWGNVRRLLLINPRKSKSGYPMVSLTVGKKVFNQTLHLLVAQVFCEKKEYHKVVNHKDSDILNPYFKNLEWTSIRENVSHSKKGDDYTSKYTGVHLSKGKYCASISINGNRKHLGVYDTEDEAHYVYMKVVEALGEENKYYKKGFKFRSDLDLSVIDDIYKPVKKTSNFKGVYLIKNTGKWKSVLCINRKKIDLGVFLTEEEAYKAYVEAVKKHRETQGKS